MIVDPNKPLPAKLGKEYWETTAKLILEEIFPERFVNLSVDKESPDLRNLEIGVEVTSIEDKDSREMDSLFCRRNFYSDKNKREKVFRRIEELGGCINEYFLIHPTRSRDLDKIYEAVRRKIEKLNDHYDIFSENYLFIYDVCPILDHELLDILGKVIEVADGYAVKFNSVFLCCLGGDLYEFDIVDNSFLHVKDSSEIIQKLAIEARRLIDEKYRAV